ncbi:MAG: ribbon-helix-helix protein, CopG family [Mariprofundaceae bacterium]|nr:ribbon-helix-helix protein, CopG family [Mariprofundaceae bacterium]
MITSYDDEMRTIVDLPEQDIQGLDALCSREHISRAEAVRRAVRGFLKIHHGDADAAFGMWRDQPQDGLTYQHKLRDEWTASTVHEPDQS